MKIDPIHFFNATGFSVLTEKFLLEENKRLEAKIKLLEKHNKALVMRIRAADNTDSAETFNS